MRQKDIKVFNLGYHQLGKFSRVQNLRKVIVQRSPDSGLWENAEKLVIFFCSFWCYLHKTLLLPGFICPYCSFVSSDWSWPYSDCITSDKITIFSSYYSTYFNLQDDK